MKRIVLCFDGTWNKPDENPDLDLREDTNVRRFFTSILPRGADGVDQLPWYDQGVGSHKFDELVGGAFGAGLELNIIQGYEFLAKNYVDGDEVYVLGFSRGAFTARSLVGMIRNCGLVKWNPVTGHIRVGTAYGIYRTRGDGPDSLTARMFRSTFAREIDIQFVGVWDTVGALGIPLELANALNLKFFEFHDTQLSKIVKHAYHAMAIDEHRKLFDVCLWNPTEQPGQALEQRWFAGSHADVGGGYPAPRLSDTALRWMQDRASALGLGLVPVQVAEGSDRIAFHDAYTLFLEGRYAKLHARHFRTIGATPFGNEVVDDSVRRRQQLDANYLPKNQGI